MTEIKKFMKELAEKNNLIVGGEQAWCSLSPDGINKCFVDFYSKKCFYVEFNSHDYEKVQETPCKLLHKMKIGERTNCSSNKSLVNLYNGVEYNTYNNHEIAQ